MAIFGLLFRAKNAVSAAQMKRGFGRMEQYGTWDDPGYGKDEPP